MQSRRTLLITKIALSLILVIGIIGMAAGPSLSSPAFGKDKHGQENQGKSKKQKDKHENRGKGNKDKRGKKQKNKKVKAEPIVAYAIQVDCTYDAGADESTCQIDADNPPNGKEINLFDLPEEDVCAPVLGGNARYVDPDPNTGVSGYRSTDSRGRMTLVLSGEVTAGGTATYWIKAANEIFPASGPGLICAEDQPLGAEATADPTSQPTDVPFQLTPEVTDSTGSIIVRSFTCSIAEARADYDWYGQCATDSAGTRYRLLRVDTETRDGLVTSTDETGRARFLSLQPGTYELTQADGDWCHAQSDNVDADGALTVEAGERTTVWIFTCAGP